MFTKSIAAGLLLAATSSAHVLHESLDHVPNGWSHASEPSSGDTMQLEVALTLNNIDQMVEQLYAVSTPGNPAYGQHWSREQVNDLVGASNESVLAVTGWASAANISHAVVGNSVHLTTTVGQAEKLLNTKFSYYQNDDGVTKLRTTAYSVGDNLSEHIDFISPTTFFGNTVAHAAIPTTTEETRDITKRQSSIDPKCSKGLTPDCVHQLYNIPTNYTPSGTSGAYIGFGSFLNQSAVESDLLKFEKKYKIPKQEFAVQIIQGGVNDQDAATAQDGEANLDAQNIIGVAHGIPVIEYITGGSPPFKPDVGNPTNTNEPYLPYYQYLLSQTNEDLPQVITNSYGDDEETVPQKYAIRVCNLIGMMGLRGISVLESSGDTGVGATCRSNTGKKLPRFTPVFPATCPYILSVGGTQDLPEIAWVGSSGGFSDYFPRPSYQETAVSNYINNEVLPETLLYYSNFANFSNRGFPDVAALSVGPGYFGFYNGTLGLNGGTSAASPVWAGIIGLLNDARLKAGKSALGFFNPLLYSSGYKHLTDITAGQSDGCNGMNTQTGANVTGAGIIPYSHWNATAGWDPVTGWGVPDFESLLNYVMTV